MLEHTLKASQYEFQAQCHDFVAFFSLAVQDLFRSLRRGRAAQFISIHKRTLEFKLMHTYSQDKQIEYYVSNVSASKRKFVLYKCWNDLLGDSFLIDHRSVLLHRRRFRSRAP